MKHTIIYIILFALLLVPACSDETVIIQDDDKIELAFVVTEFSRSRAPELGTTGERQIDNLYLFLFPTDVSQTLVKYYVDMPAFSGGSWNSTTNKITLEKAQAEIRNREVYLVANCSGIKTALDAVNTLADLQSVLLEQATPWSPAITTPLLMSGRATHNFMTDYRLDNISLERAVAKLQINIALKTDHQGLLTITDGSSAVLPQYQYRILNFDKNMYVLKPSTKTDNLASTSWIPWQSTPAITSYTTDGSGKVNSLTLTTYLNERDVAGATIEISLPYTPSGSLPPPEFGDEIYKLQLPATITRNTLYIYDIEI